MHGAIPRLFSYNFVACYLIKHRGNFTFTFAPYFMLGASIINVKRLFSDSYYCNEHLYTYVYPSRREWIVVWQETERPMQ